MRRFLAGLVTGAVLATAVTAAANQPIRLFVDGREIVFPDAPPQMINNRVMVPARPPAEALGAKVEWDAAQNAVVVTSQVAQSMSPVAPAGGTHRFGERVSLGQYDVIVHGLVPGEWPGRESNGKWSQAQWDFHVKWYRPLFIDVEYVSRSDTEVPVQPPMPLTNVSKREFSQGPYNAIQEFAPAWAASNGVGQVRRLAPGRSVRVKVDVGTVDSWPPIVGVLVGNTIFVP